MGTEASQQSIDSINDTIITQPKPSSSVTSNGNIASGGRIIPSGMSVSSSEINPVPPSTDPLTYEPYRPPSVLSSQERINPFDKNKTTAYDNKPSGIYSSLTSVSTASTTVIDDKLKDQKPVLQVEDSTKPSVASFSASSGFDYSYKMEKQDSKPSEVVVEKKEIVAEKKEEVVEKKEKSSRHKFERKLSDADIIFGSKPEPYTSSFKFENYSRNRSNSSFTSTSTDSDYVYGARDLRKDNPFQKSLSVSSDKDADIWPKENDGSNISESRAYQGINNDAFSDYDSPKTSAVTNKPWSNTDDDYDLK